jgi:hypothetical protein
VFANGDLRLAVRLAHMPSKADVDYADSVEPIVRKAAAWAWRLFAILAALVAVLWVIARLEIIVVPLLLALMVSALLLPAVDWLDLRGAPRGPGRHLDVRHQPVRGRCAGLGQPGHPQH